MKKLFLAASLSLSVFAVACGGSAPKADVPHADEHGAATDTKDLKPNGEAKIGDKTKCPVSGEVFTVAADTPKIEYKGKTYYTCCSGCMNKVKADPGKYLDKPQS